MQLEMERHHRLDKGLCLYCGGTRDFKATCPMRFRKVKGTPAPVMIYNQFHLSVVLSLHNISVSLFALIDSGSAGNLISSTLVNSVDIPVEKLAIMVSV